VKIPALAVLGMTGLTVAEPEALSIAHARGESVTLAVRVRSDDGMYCSPVGCVFTLRISPTFEGAGSIFRSVTTPTSASPDWVQDLVISLSNVPVGTYKWDLFIARGGSNYQAIPESSWQVLDSTLS